LYILIAVLLGCLIWSAHARAALDKVEEDIEYVKSGLEQAEVRQTATRNVVYAPVRENAATAIVEALEEAEEETGPEYISLGEFTITGYCSCEACCGKWSVLNNRITASGTTMEEGRTVGADWAMLPAGTSIYIDGFGERIVEDKPAGWIVERYGGKIIDLYFDDHAEAWAIGRKTAEVFVERTCG